MQKRSADYKKFKVRHVLFTWSNAISASRALISFPIIYLHYINNFQISWPIVTLLIYGVISDYLDGFVARKTDRISELGKALDPIADKLSAFLLFSYAVYIHYIPLWFFIFALTRDLLILTGSVIIRIKRGKLAMAVTSGKVTVNALAAYWLSVFFFPGAIQIHFFFMGCSIALMVFSFFDYLQRFKEIIYGAEFN